MMKLKEYTVWGDNGKYIDITFVTNSEYDIKFSSIDGKPFEVDCRGVLMTDLLEAIDIIQSGVITL